MPDEFDFKKYKSFEEYAESVEGYRYIHDVYLKAVNHPVRRGILKIINERGDVSEEFLFTELKKQGTIKNMQDLQYNLDYLLKAFCIKRMEEADGKLYRLTKNGKIINYLE
jgi:hypothetical protein